MLSSYSTSNLIRASEFLLTLSKTLNTEVARLQSLKDEVVTQQQETHKRGQLVKKMTDYLSDELGRIEFDTDTNSASSLNKNLEKLSQTETSLRVLRGRLDEFIAGDDTENLKKSDSTISADLKRYESFLLDVTNLLNERIPQMEKVIERIKAEVREAQQQKLLLSEMADLFGTELEGLDAAFAEIRGKTTVS